MIHAVGDIHGQIGEFDRALRLIDAVGEPDAPVVFLGDYTDRGPDSRAVIDRLIAEREARPHSRIFLRGNHDRMFMRFLSDGIIADPGIKSGKTWLNPALGGGTTLASYGVEVPDPDTLARLGHDSKTDAILMQVLAEARAAVPSAHIDFFDKTLLLHDAGAQVFVHAGIRPGVLLSGQTEDDLLWIRKPFLSERRDHGALIVHGHTALDAPQHYGNRLNVDSGAGHGRPITAALLEGRSAWALTKHGRQPILP